LKKRRDIRVRHACGEPMKNGIQYGSAATAKQLGISLRQLYYWINVFKIVEPVRIQHGKKEYWRFTTQDVNTLRQMRDLIEFGYMVKAAAVAVKGIKTEAKKHAA
jgi:DNA-binding transcriptional MerR regulator